MIHRRDFLSLAALLAAPSAEAGVADPIGQYDAQGIHRTGTAVDRASADWLAGLVRATGLTPALEPFPLSRVDPEAVFVEAGGRRAEGLPMFDGSFTNAAGIRGRLGKEIGWLEVVPNNEAGPLLELRKAGRHQAIIAVTKGGAPGLCPVNAASFAHPYGPPVVQIAGEEADWLREWERSGAEVNVSAVVKRTPLEALNVTAIRKGSNASLAPVVVMTPRSGWWQCASERGGGLMCWLEVMRSVPEPARDFIFVASSGHELGHRGLDHFIEKRPGIVKDAHAWIHFGANIGAAIGPAGTMQFSDAQLQTTAMAAVAAQGLKVNQRPVGQAPAGEAGNIHRGGGRYVSLVGGNNLFHSTSDRWPQAVNTDSLGKFAAAFTQTARQLATAD